jgi:hypothetical protein
MVAAACFLTRLQSPHGIVDDARWPDACTSAQGARMMVDGIFMPGERQTDHAQLIDFQNPAKNDFLVVNQFAVTGTKKPRRPDLMVFVNGLPLRIVELKNPANMNAEGPLAHLSTLPELCSLWKSGGNNGHVTTSSGEMLPSNPMIRSSLSR